MGQTSRSGLAGETAAVPAGRLQSDASGDPDGFAPLRVARVVSETADAVSLILDVPAAHLDRFQYQAGQYVTLRVTVDGVEHQRCYSMSSSPAHGEPLRITVKRDPGGVVSNWINDTVVAGINLQAAPPLGRFVLDSSDRDVVAFAGGSGITPVFSLIRTALASTGRRVRLLYANRSPDAVIFADQLTNLGQEYADRLTIRHHLDSDTGVLTAADITEFLGGAADGEYFICGPTPFMDTVQATLSGLRVPDQRVHLERFVTATAPVLESSAHSVHPEEVTIELAGRVTAAPYRAGNTLLQTARMAGLKAPSSCETGSCGTCMARLEVGSARLLNNDALDPDELAQGWVLTCQAIPTSQTVRVVYE